MGLFDKLKRQKKSDDKQPEKAEKVHDEKKHETEQKKTVKSAPDAKAKKNKETVPLGDNHRVLLRPLLTEKTFRLQQQNKYSFYIDPKANKNQVRDAIKEIYGVKPVSIAIMRRQPEVKTRWGRSIGKTKMMKKAVVTMPEGTVLNLTE